jgi:prolyl-tRNA editing enzyme YbaK/EbsC (Cys-tRNA(Pro) deacylase)
LKKLTGKKDLRFMDGKSVEKRFGFVVGAIAPVADILAGLLLYVDSGVFEEQFVDISSGDPRAGLELKAVDLRRLLGNATMAEITKVG